MNADKRLLKVFLCHSSNDKPAVRKLYDKLIASGVDVWLDEKKLLAGQQWDIEIQKAVHESDVVIVCLSNTSITKEGYVQKEIKFALDVALEKPEGTIYLIPVRIEECKVPHSLSAFHWIDIFNEDNYGQLVKSLHARADSLGVSIKKNEDVKIGLWGLPSSGKTTFITMLQYSDCKGWAIAPKGRKTQDSYIEYAQMIRDQLVFPPPTLADKVQYMTYEFIEPNTQLFGGYRYQVVIPEASGKFYESPGHYPDLLQEFSQYNAIIFLIDPENANEGNSRLQKRSYQRIIQEWLYSLQAIRGGGIFSQSMAFCLTKIDLTTYSVNRDRPIDYCLNILGSDVENFLSNYCDSKRINFFATSSIGFTRNGESARNPKDPSKILEASDPINLFDPFLWIFNSIK